MNSHKTKINACVILLSSILAASCTDSAENQSQNGLNNSDTVITKASGPTVALTSEQVNVNKGETFTLDITMSDFPTSEGGGVTVRFDATMLNVIDVAIDTGIWNFVNKVGAIDNNSGVVSDILFSSYNGVSGNSKIATITFNAISSGNSEINLEGSAFNPFSSNGSKIAANFTSTNTTITATTVN